MGSDLWNAHSCIISRNRANLASKKVRCELPHERPEYKMYRLLVTAWKKVAYIRFREKKQTMEN